MRYSVTGAQMKAIDRETIDRIGIPSMVLMERAALEVVKEVKDLAGGDKKQPVWSVCGTGNNGADGIAAGRILHEQGYDVTVILTGTCDQMTKEHKQQQQIARAIGVRFIALGSEASFVDTDQVESVESLAYCMAGSRGIVIDAIFGIGLSRPVTGRYQDLIAMLKRQMSCQVVAVDIPSGIHADTGQVMGIALPAKRTVTFGYEKSGLLCYPGRTYAGVLRIADIGFPGQVLLDIGWDAKILETKDLKRLPERMASANKGTFGKLLIIAGSEGMSGAAYLSAYSAYRMGTGLVKVLTVEENRPILQMQLPEAIIETYDRHETGTDSLRQWMEGQCDWATAIVLGPGLGRDAYVNFLVETVLAHAYVPVVLDADALNTISESPQLTGYYTENIVITPHMGEMARLTGNSIPELKEDALAAAREYSCQYGITCVLKDAVTIIADKDGETWLNTSGNSGMAKAGSGDVLTGVIGGLLAQGMEMTEAAVYGTYLHGRAGDLAVCEKGNRSLLAHEIADFMNQVIKESEHQ